MVEQISSKIVIGDDEIVKFSAAVLGLVLNLCLLLLLFHVRSRFVIRLRNQRLFLVVLASSYSLVCLVFIVQFLLEINHHQKIASCFKNLKNVTYLCQFLLLGSILGCAADNYLAVCKPFYHRANRSSIARACTIWTIVWCVVATFLAFSDLILPVQFEPMCFNVTQRVLPGYNVAMSLIQANSLDQLASFCRVFKDCMLTSSTLEISVMVIWAIVVGPVVFFHISTAVTLRKSLKKLLHVRQHIVATPQDSFTNGILAFNSHLVNRNFPSKCFIPNSKTNDRSMSEQLPQKSQVNDIPRKHSEPPKVTLTVHSSDGEEKAANVQRPQTLELAVNGSAGEIKKGDDGGDGGGEGDNEGGCNNLLSPNHAMSNGSDYSKRRRVSSLNEMESDCKKVNRVRRFSLLSFGSISLGERRQSTVQAAQAFHLRNRRRLAYVLHFVPLRKTFKFFFKFRNMQVCILFIFLLTWFPELALEISNKLFFDETTRVEVMPQFFFITKHFKAFILVSILFPSFSFGPPRPNHHSVYHYRFFIPFFFWNRSMPWLIQFYLVLEFCNDILNG